MYHPSVLCSTQAEEAGRREAELTARDAADEEFRRVMRVRQGTVDRYLSEVIQVGDFFFSVYVHSGRIRSSRL